METIEEKAKAYDEAIEKLRDFYRDYDTISTLIDIKEELEEIFPELKEGKDEKIRKAIKYCIKQGFIGCGKIENVTPDECLAWLEKQGETYTKKDVDDAYLKGVCDAKQELEKQSEKKLANSAKTCKKSQRMVSAKAKEALYSKPEGSLLDKALDFIVETQEDNDYICEKMSEFSDEWDYCVNNCQNLKKECVIRFLKHYEKSE